MPKSTIIIAFDQHAATTVAAVLLLGQRTPAVHTNFLTNNLNRQSVSHEISLTISRCPPSGERRGSTAGTRRPQAPSPGASVNMFAPRQGRGGLKWGLYEVALQRLGPESRARAERTGQPPDLEPLSGKQRLRRPIGTGDQSSIICFWYRGLGIAAGDDEHILPLVPVGNLDRALERRGGSGCRHVEDLSRFGDRCELDVFHKPQRLLSTRLAGESSGDLTMSDGILRFTSTLTMSLIIHKKNSQPSQRGTATTGTAWMVHGLARAFARDSRGCRQPRPVRPLRPRRCPPITNHPSTLCQLGLHALGYVLRPAAATGSGPTTVSPSASHA